MKKLLVALVLISVSNFAIAKETAKITSKTKATKESSLTKLFAGKKTLVFDFGFSANMLLSDFSTAANGLGMGNQYSFALNFNTNASKGFKIIYQGVLAKENNFRKTETNSGTGTYFRSFEQEWNMIGFGVESRKSNRLVNWYYDWMFGYAFGKKSRIQTQQEGIDQPIINSEEPTRSFLYASFAGGIRKKIHKKWFLNSSFRTYALLGSIYGDSLKSRSLVLVPVMANFGVEYKF